MEFGVSIRLKEVVYRGMGRDLFDRQVISRSCRVLISVGQLTGRVHEVFQPGSWQRH